MHSVTDNARGLAAIIADMKAELVDFVQTRFEILKEELREKTARLKLAVPLAAMALVLLGTAYLLITLAIVSAVTALFASSAYRWVFGFGIVGVAWAILGALAGYFAKRELEVKTLMPNRTIEVLRADKIWLQQEARMKV